MERFEGKAMQLMEYKKAAELLKRYKIGSIDSRSVTSAEQAIAFAGGGKIVMKVLSDKALHKSKAGLVKVGLQDKSEIGNAFRELEAKGKKYSPFKVLAQKMAKPGIEVIVGGRKDAQFGNLVLIGLGGIYVETFRDFALRVCPISKFDAEEMIGQLKSRKVITYNGKLDGALVSLLLRVSKLLTENDFAELDLNPVILREDGYDVVDIRVLS